MSIHSVPEKGEPREEEKKKKKGNALTPLPAEGKKKGAKRPPLVCCRKGTQKTPGRGKKKKGGEATPRWRRNKGKNGNPAQLQ